MNFFVQNNIHIFSNCSIDNKAVYIQKEECYNMM